MPVDGQRPAIVFGGVDVGGIQSVTIGQGSITDVAMRAFCQDNVQYQPGLVDRGLVTVVLYRDPVDSGQSNMAASRSGRLVAPFTVTLNDGSVYSLEGYVTTIPTLSGITGVQTGTAQIRITSGVV